MKLPLSIKVLSLISLFWAVVLPYFWVKGFADRMGFSYAESVQYIVPELGAKEYSTLPGVPDGEYLVIQFQN